MIKHTLPLLEAPRARASSTSPAAVPSAVPQLQRLRLLQGRPRSPDRVRGRGAGTSGHCGHALAPGIIATEAHQATLRAGAERAGAVHYRRTLAVLNEAGADVQRH